MLLQFSELCLLVLERNVNKLEELPDCRKCPIHWPFSQEHLIPVWNLISVDYPLKCDFHLLLAVSIASNPNTHNSSDPHSATSTEPVNTKANWHSQLGGAQWPWGAWAVCQDFQTKTDQTWIHSGETACLSACQCGTWGLIFQVWRETAIPSFPRRTCLNRVMLWPLCGGFLRNNRKSHTSILLPCWF